MSSASAARIAFALALIAAASQAREHDHDHDHAQLAPAQAREHAKSEPHGQQRQPARQHDHGQAHAQTQEQEHEQAHERGHEHAPASSTPTSDAADRPAPAHVPPPPPEHVMGDMAYDEMVEVMGMDDRAPFGLFSLDRLERVEGGATAWSLQASLGGDVDRVVLRSEGERVDGGIDHADLELLWGHAIAPFWDSRVGLRHDLGRGPARTWAGFGVQGLAPYWFEVSATAYFGTQGRTALRVEADYELLLTQRLVLQPRVELNAYGKDDPEARTGSGLSDASIGVRLRYEIRRELAPYIGVQQARRFGDTADYARAHGEDASDLEWVAGVRVWF